MLIDNAEDQVMEKKKCMAANYILLRLCTWKAMYSSCTTTLLFVLQHKEPSGKHVFALLHFINVVIDRCQLKIQR